MRPKRVLTGEIRTSHSFTDSSTESVKSALSSSAYNRSPRLTRRPTTRRRIDIDPVRRYAGDRLPRIAYGSIWIFTEMTQPYDWT